MNPPCVLYIMVSPGALTWMCRPRFRVCVAAGRSKLLVFDLGFGKPEMAHGEAFALKQAHNFGERQPDNLGEEPISFTTNEPAMP